MGIELDKDISATMTEEELAAINEELSPEDIASMKSIAGSEDEDEDDDQAGEESAPEVVPIEGAAANEEAPEAKPALANAADDEFKPSYSASLPEGYDDNVKALNDELKGLAKQFKDGDIDFDQYSADMQALNERRDALVQEKLKVEVINDMRFQEWQDSKVSAFQSLNGESIKEGIDYSTDEGKFNVLNKHFTNIEADPAYAGKSAKFMLTTAHRLAKAELGIETKAAPAGEVSQADALKAAKAARKPPIDAAPKTLAQVPGSDGPGDVTGEFSDIDALDGMELEDAVARMTPAQRDRYLKAA